MARYATIDVGTNTVLLLVADTSPTGLRPVAERGVITRLGKGVDASRRLAPDAMERTLEAIGRFAAEARTLGAQGLAVSATSAARDAQNGADFLAAARQRAGVEVEILSGEEEARLSYLAISIDFSHEAAERELVALDVGGGSTEFIYGHGSAVRFHTSLNIGSVRLTERCVHADPPSADDFARLRAQVRQALAALPSPGANPLVVGVAGTVTTLYTVRHGIVGSEGAPWHGGWLTRQEVADTRAQLAQVPLAVRRTLPGLQPERADVIVAGAVLVEEALDRLGAPGLRVSDHGLRWGLLAARFGGARA